MSDKPRDNSPTPNVFAHVTVDNRTYLRVYRNPPDSVSVHLGSCVLAGTWHDVATAVADIGRELNAIELRRQVAS